MLKQMGYQEGKGLGANLNGRLEPLEIKFRIDNSGVGYISNKQKNISKRKRIELIRRKEETLKSKILILIQLKYLDKSKKKTIEMNKLLFLNIRKNSNI